DGGLGAVIIAQDNVRQRMQEGSQRQAAAAPEALPVITFANDVTLHLNGEDIHVLHLAHGHTDGDSVLLFPVSKVAHLGDLFFNQRFPFVDLSSGGDVLGLQRDIAQLVPQIPADWKIIPGHGPLASLDDLKLYQRMLDESVRTVKDAMAKGQTREQVLAA